MNSKKYWLATAGLGCVTLFLAAMLVIVVLVIVPLQIRSAVRAAVAEQPAAVPAVQEGNSTSPSQDTGLRIEEKASLSALYKRVNPGIVNIKVTAGRGRLVGQGQGSGFVYDDKGHIVTNNHVVDDVQRITVVYYNGFEAEATLVGKDPNSDLAVIKVENLPEGVYPLSLGDSDQVVVGEDVIAIGNPFGLGSSMTAGIVSAVGRTIDSGATPFSIPHAIQTDAAINPGNSGGPLLNLQGQVIGVNAQIATGGAQSSAGVGFAIPSNIVRRVVPVLVEEGSYSWPWLGISGGSVNLALMKANNLPSQDGAYIDAVTPDGPADRAGLRGSTGARSLGGAEAPTGGDVITAVDGEPISDFDDLLVAIASHKPGDKVTLTILRDGKSRQVTVTLMKRPDENIMVPS